MFDGKVAIVTGSGNGIARATAELLAAEGGSVVISDVDGDAAHDTAEGGLHDRPRLGRCRLIRENFPPKPGGSDMTSRVFVIGVGMTKFEKPGRREWNYPDMARESGTNALEDAGIAYDEVEQAFVGYVYGDSTAGQRAIYELGLTGLPVVNVNNNCSTGSSALYLARQVVRYGIADCVMALGFEQMERGSLSRKFLTHIDPLDRHEDAMHELYAPVAVPTALEMFGNTAIEHMQQYGSEPDHFAWIGWKNHKHSVDNPYAQFQQEYSLDEIKGAQAYHGPLTKLQCSPTSDGSGAAIVASERFVDEHDLWGQAIEIRGQALVTDMASTFETRSCRNIVGYDMGRVAARRAYEEAGAGPENIDVVELHDCFSSMELITYEALGFAPEGEGHKLIDKQATTYGGDGPVVNPSGGLISKGHPLGATGLAQCSELTWQLRGEAGKRQVKGAKMALQHNVGLGGAAVVTIYAPPDAA
jgi:sterol carrier protein 2